jgi:hypothetical protein
MPLVQGEAAKAGVWGVLGAVWILIFVNIAIFIQVSWSDDTTQNDSQGKALRRAGDTGRKNRPGVPQYCLPGLANHREGRGISTGRNGVSLYQTSSIEKIRRSQDLVLATRLSSAGEDSVVCACNLLRVCFSALAPCFSICLLVQFVSLHGVPVFRAALSCFLGFFLLRCFLLVGVFNLGKYVSL